MSDLTHNEELDNYSQGKIKRENTLFIPAYTLGWVIYFLITFFNIYGFNDEAPNVMLRFVGFSVIGYIVFFTAHIIYEYLNIKNSKQTEIYLIILIGSLLTPVIWTAFTILIIGDYISFDLTHTMSDIVKGNSRNYLTPMFFYGFYMLSTAFGWHMIYFLPEMYRRMEFKKENFKEAEFNAKTFQLKALHMQLNPHFMFNALNSIRGLISENSDNAVKMVTYLSEYMRHSLNDNLVDVQLSDEIDRIKHYLEIEQLRFEKNLNVIYKIGEKTKAIQIKANLIHPIVENAVKYGMKTSSLPLTIEISTLMLGKELLIKVCNSGRWINPLHKDTSGTHTGLENTQLRLQKAYPNKHNFEIIPLNNKVCVKITLIMTGDNNE